MILVLITSVYVELGSGWSPTVLNSEEELNFVLLRELQIDSKEFHIGGSTNATRSNFNYTEYIPDDTGTIILSKYSFFAHNIILENSKLKNQRHTIVHVFKNNTDVIEICFIIQK